MKGHRSTECKNEGKSGGGYVPRAPTCYTCSKVGHRSTECTAGRGSASVKKETTPNRMGVVLSSKSGKAGNVAYGFVNGVRTEVLIDSGAELGSVPKALVPKQVVLCNDVLVKGYGGCERQCKSFMCEFVVGGYRKIVKTVIDECESSGVLSIVPFSVTNEAESIAYRQAIQEFVSGEKVEVNVLTRSGVRKEKELDENEKDAEVEDLWCTVEESDQKEQEVELEPSVVPAEVESKQKCLRESVVEVDGELIGIPMELGKVEVGDGESELTELAGQIGPMRRGSDGKDFREKLLADDGLRTRRE